MKQGPEDRRSEPRRRRARRPGDRRRIVAGLVVSGLAHLLLIVLYPYFTVPYPRGAPVPVPPPPTPDAEGIQVLQIVEVVTPETAPPADPVEIETPDEVVADVEVPDFEEEPPVRFHEYRSAVERLRLGEGDPRLWRPIDPARVAPTPEHLLETMLAYAIRESNDSIAAAIEAAMAATDWTRTDDEGRKWGVSPGKIHLGDITIPLPFGFGPPPDYSGDRAEMAFRMADIERAASTAVVRRSWKERREAMKKRREELRALRQKEKGKEKGEVGKPPVVKPDTTSSRPGRR
ncbi:MAG: hypothetical protein F4139_04795 [Gemmatimonadetes bacterium]|nr:hypothetical protein [Gemmatimonadota bacterium]MYH52253.1 hypothetical protein [Gemmatimonadota bacterium]MYK66391.1 hypothetical protein [Gemmatimonadota bacterium]